MVRMPEMSWSEWYAMETIVQGGVLRNWMQEHLVTQSEKGESGLPSGLHPSSSEHREYALQI